MVCLSSLISVSIATQAIAQHVSFSNVKGRPTCTVRPGNNNATDDVPVILEAFQRCGNGGNVVFPANETYHINSRLNPVLNDVNIDWHGEWLVSLELTTLFL